MNDKEIIKVAMRLSNKLSQADVKAKDKGIDEGYISQLLSYAIVQYAKNKDKAILNLKTLIKEMEDSGFAKRQFGKRKNHFVQAKIILESEKSLFTSSMEDLIKILGYTVRLMKYYESKKG